MGTILEGALAIADRSAAASANGASAFGFGSATPGDPAQQIGMDQLLRALDNERRRLGQDLHDSAGQLIACLQLSIARLEIEDPEHGGLIHEIQDITREIGAEIRSLAFLQYPVELADRGLASAVEALSRGFGSRTGIKTAFTLNGDVSGLERYGGVGPAPRCAGSAGERLSPRPCLACDGNIEATEPIGGADCPRRWERFA